MALRRVLKMGEPMLREVAAAVTRFDAELAALVTDMDDTMPRFQRCRHCRPADRVSARVVIFELRDNPRYPHLTPFPTPCW